MLAAEAMDVDEVTQTVFGERKTVRLKPTSTYRGGGVRGGLAQTEVLKGEEQHPRDQRRVAGGRKAQCPRSRMSGTAWPEFSDTDPHSASCLISQSLSFIICKMKIRVSPRIIVIIK